MNTMESPAPNTVVYVATLPTCNLCPTELNTPAKVDAKTFQGPWASMCDRHWRTWSAFPSATQDGDPELGLGKGQLYVIPEPSTPEEDHTKRREAAEKAARDGDIDAFFDAIGDGDILDYL